MGLVLICWLLAAIAQDSLHRRIPNALVLVGAALALFALALDDQPFGLAWTDALTGAAVAFGALMCFYLPGLMGAGDVKFAGALGLWVGLQPLLPIWLAASLLAGLHALLWLALKRWPVFPRLVLALSGVDTSGVAHGRATRHIPFAAYLAIAAMGFMVWHQPT